MRGIGAAETDRALDPLPFDLHRVADVADAHLVAVERVERTVLGVRPELESLAADDDLALGALAHGDADGLGGVRGAGGEEREEEDRAHPGCRGSPLQGASARISHGVEQEPEREPDPALVGRHHVRDHMSLVERSDVHVFDRRRNRKWQGTLEDSLLDEGERVAEIEGSDTAALPEAGRKEATFRLEANPESMQPHRAHLASIQ